MNNRTVSIRDWLKLLLIMTAIGGCGAREESSRISSPDREGRADVRLDAQDSGREIIRAREDLPRNRLWVLTLSEVRVYNTAATGKKLIRKIALPTWSVIGFHNVCMPDMALDRAGSAYISSNGQARLLRIDADRFELRDLAISFPERDGLDSGFGALAFGADGTLFARTTPGGLLWKVDIAKSSATMAAANSTLPADECAITTQSITTQWLNAFERT
jgi:hypothetical protein